MELTLLITQGGLQIFSFSFQMSTSLLSSSLFLVLLLKQFFQHDSKCNYSPIYPFMHQTAFLLWWNGEWRVVIVDQGRPAGGAGAQFLALAAGSPWTTDMLLVVGTKNTAAYEVSPCSQRLWRFPPCQPYKGCSFHSSSHQVIPALCPRPQQASSSLKLSECERFRRAWKPVTLQKSTSNKQLEHTDTWG